MKQLSRYKDKTEESCVRLPGGAKGLFPPKCHDKLWVHQHPIRWVKTGRAGEK